MENKVEINSLLIIYKDLLDKFLKLKDEKGYLVNLFEEKSNVYELSLTKKNRYVFVLKFIVNDNTLYLLNDLSYDKFGLLNSEFDLIKRIKFMNLNVIKYSYLNYIYALIERLNNE